MGLVLGKSKGNSKQSSPRKEQPKQEQPEASTSAPAAEKAVEPVVQETSAPPKQEPEAPAPAAPPVEQSEEPEPMRHQESDERCFPEPQLKPEFLDEPAPAPAEPAPAEEAAPCDGAEFPEFKSTGSLVAKHVTKEKWDKLCLHKTATCGFTLAQACACAIQFDDQGVGFYAGDEDTYIDFAEVTDPIICDYHGLSEGFKHTSNMDPTQVKGSINAEAPVHSTRIRVGRSIAGFGLSPGITKEQRLEVEGLMKKAFGNLTGDLAGNYYPLLGMEEDVRQKLVDDHFLFVSGDKNLIAAGMERDWPEGRGIFHNDKKTFLTWVNEEDQLRIISMQQGGDVAEVFTRLAGGIKAIQDSVKAESGRDFQISDRFGYLHSCPTNLGTGMRASVHIDLPGWTAEGLPALKAKCEELKLQPRGTRGESGGQTGCTYDISNKHRLGYSEVELVQCMIDGVNELYAMDLDLQNKHGLYPIFRSKDSLVAKYCTEEIWNELKDHKTATTGFTLKQAMMCGIAYDDQHNGVYAGDEDTFIDFAKVFTPIINEYHGLSDDFKHVTDMDPEKVQGSINPEAPVHSTRIRVGRNVKGYGLSPGITREQRLEHESMMKTAFSKLEGDLSGQYYPLLGMEETVRQQLVDDHFLFVSGDKNLKTSGMERDWPEGRGIFHNTEKTFLTWVNEEDQLRIISMQKGGDVACVFKRLARGIKAIQDTVQEAGKDFQLSEKFGYIHSCPSNLGTGMRASVHIDLPGWTAEGLPALKAKCEELKLQPRGTRGESGGQTGCTFDISNKHRLGYSEVELVQCMIDGVNELYKMDLDLQNKHGLYPIFRSKDSLVAKYCTEEIWEKLKDHKTATTGFTLKQAMMCGIAYDDQHNGVYAGDEDTYIDFSDVFTPIINEYHGLADDFKHVSDMDPEKVVGSVDPAAPVHSTRIRVGRNVQGYGLSPGITRDQRLEHESTMKTAFSKLEGDLAGQYYPLLGMEEDVRQQLVNDHFLFVSGDKNLITSGMERDWPEGRGIFHNTDKTFLTWVNEEDQLRIISMQKGGDVGEVFRRLARGIKAIQDTVQEAGKDFQLSEKFGYIHSCPSNLGTGMRASVHIDLPGWTAAGLPALKAKCEELKLQPRGTRGESGGQTGCTYDISNKHRLGYSEVELVQCMIDGVNELYKTDLELQAEHGVSA